MAHYTTMVRSVLETYAGYKEEQGFDKIDEIISKTHGVIFTKYYDLWEESYKSVIESKILYHYYMREINAETAALWRYYMNRTMTEVMPYYSKLYESAALKFDPFKDVDYFREGDRAGTEDVNRTSTMIGKEETEGKDSGSITDDSTAKNTQTTNRSMTNSNDNKDRFSDTPQNGLSQVENNQYLTTYRNVTDQGSGSENGTVTDNGTNSNVRTLNTTATGSKDTRNDTNAVDDIDTTERWLEHIYGKMGTASYSKMLQEYRDTLLNIDEMVIAEFKDCFLNLV